MNKIPLTHSRYALVDEIDAITVMETGSWCYESGYAVHYYANEQGRRRRLWIHRLIMIRALGHPIPAGMQVDHVNGNRLDNRRSNLRLATKSQNQAAKRSQVNSTSGQKGVTFRKGKYDVRLRYQHRRLYLGRYTSFKQAKAVYAHAHTLLWQEFSSEAVSTTLRPSLKAHIEARIEHFLAHS